MSKSNTTTTPQAVAPPKVFPVSVIAEGDVCTEKDRWSTTLDLERSTILTVSAYTRATYWEQNTEDDPVNAGINTFIRLDGEVVSADQSFEAFSDTVPFHSAASFSRFLKKGRYTLEVQRENLGSVHRDFMLRASYHAVAARPGPQGSED